MNQNGGGRGGNANVRYNIMCVFVCDVCNEKNEYHYKNNMWLKSSMVVIMARTGRRL